MRRLRFAPFVFRVVLGTALSSSASPGHAMRACRSDIETLCPDAHGRFEVGECLRANEAELSEECFAVHNAKEACRADAEALCPEARHPREVRACLHENEAELSPECATMVQAGRERREACQAEMAALCPDAQSRSERRTCIQEHVEELPEGCHPHRRFSHRSR